jgi:hypothetical protein
MSPLTIGALIFAFTFGGALAGMWLRATLPQRHLDNESQRTINVAIGLIATMTALVLGLVTASAKSSFDVLDAAVKQSAVELLTLDRTLARYGPQSEMAREALRVEVVAARKKAWHDADPTAPETRPAEAQGRAESVVKYILALPEQNAEQRWLKGVALEHGEALLKARWLRYSSIGTSVPVPFLVVLMFWLMVIFAGFGLFAPRNGTVISILLVCALTVASAIFIILEMDGPFAGVIRISPEPLDYALALIDQ